MLANLLLHMFEQHGADLFLTSYKRPDPTEQALCQPTLAEAPKAAPANSKAADQLALRSRAKGVIRMDFEAAGLLSYPFQ